MARHTADALCPSCEEKLQSAHPKLRDFFHTAKEKYADLHVAWSYRDQVSQDLAYNEGKSRLRFPSSAHNKTPSLALDLFQIDSEGLAVFSGLFMAKLSAEMGAGLKWGGDFKSLGDFDHFELVV